MKDFKCGRIQSSHNRPTSRRSSSFGIGGWVGFFLAIWPAFRLFDVNLKALPGGAALNTLRY
jgi:hypothetical protein